MRGANPPNFFASKYSLPHAAAVMAVRGRAQHSDIDDSALLDPAITALRTRVSVVEDPAMSALVPKLKPARVTVTLKNGRSATHACESHEGDFNQPYAETVLRDKFRELAGHVLSEQDVAQVEQAIDRCEEWQSVSDFTVLLKRP
jgi:2-methylcitrate dehydratase PrpD